MKEVTCPSRTKRRHPGQSQLMPRELEALHFIARAQPVTASHYATYLGLSLPVARRSLRKLRDLGVVDVHVTSVAAKSRFTLSRCGRTTLAKHLNCSPDDITLMRGLSRVNLEHHDGSVELFVALRLAMKLPESRALQSFVFEHELRKRLKRTRGALLPDSVAVFTDRHEGKFAVAFEVDLATETVAYVVRNKALPYADCRDQGVPLLQCERWAAAFIVPSIERRNRLATSFWEAGIPEGLFFFAQAATITKDTILTPVWWTPRIVGKDGIARLVSDNPVTCLVQRPGTTVVPAEQ